MRFVYKQDGKAFPSLVQELLRQMQDEHGQRQIHIAVVHLVSLPSLEEGRPTVTVTGAMVPKDIDQDVVQSVHLGQVLMSDIGHYLLLHFIAPMPGAPSDEPTH